MTNGVTTGTTNGTTNGSSGQPTLEAVAARAGVGRGTVSRVINGSPQVSERTRVRVLRAVDELGYVPNMAARALEDAVWTDPTFGEALAATVQRLRPVMPRPAD